MGGTPVVVSGKDSITRSHSRTPSAPGAMSECVSAGVRRRRWRRARADAAEDGRRPRGLERDRGAHEDGGLPGRTHLGGVGSQQDVAGRQNTHLRRDGGAIVGRVIVHRAGENAGRQPQRDDESQEGPGAAMEDRREHERAVGAGVPGSENRLSLQVKVSIRLLPPRVPEGACPSTRGDRHPPCPFGYRRYLIPAP